MNNKIKERCKRGFQRFCDGTSCHGFTELYHAKTLFWAAVWVVILIAAFGLTIYQVYVVIIQYTEQPTTTVIVPAKENQILYPPMRLCHALWMFWIDWQKATSLGFTRSEILFALSYMNVIYTSTEFDVNKAESDFLTTMAKNNFRTLTEFYSAIAKKMPIVSENGFSTYFDKIEIFFKYPGYMLCYSISEKQMLKFFTDNQQVFDGNDGQKIISFQSKDPGYQDVSDFITPLEYNRYMLRWIGAKSMYKIEGNTTQLDKLNLTNFTPPMLVYPNGYDTESVDLYTENDAYSVDMTADSRTLRDTPQNKCLEGINSFASNRTCRTYCRAIRDRKCTCRSIDLASLLNEDYDLKRLCYKGIYVIKSMSKTDDLFLSNVNQTYTSQSCPLSSVEVKNAHEKCKATCVPACQIWTWDITVSVTQMSEFVRSIGRKSMTNVTIEYPVASKIMIMTEELWCTWENLLGNVGGLLGVWTGASLVSVVQFFYLCCFADTSISPSMIFQSFQQKLDSKEKIAVESKTGGYFDVNKTNSDQSSKISKINCENF